LKQLRENPNRRNDVDQNVGGEKIHKNRIHEKKWENTSQKKPRVTGGRISAPNVTHWAVSEVPAGTPSRGKKRNKGGSPIKKGKETPTKKKKVFSLDSKIRRKTKGKKRS